MSQTSDSYQAIVESAVPRLLRGEYLLIHQSECCHW